MKIIDIIDATIRYNNILRQYHKLVKCAGNKIKEILKKNYKKIKQHREDIKIKIKIVKNEYNRLKNKRDKLNKQQYELSIYYKDIDFQSNKNIEDIYNYAFDLEENSSIFKQNKIKAIKYYKMTADYDDSGKYTYIYAKKIRFGNEAVIANKSEAIEYYKKTININNCAVANAKYDYAEMLSNGEGAEQNKKKSLELLETILNDNLSINELLENKIYNLIKKLQQQS